MDYIQTDDLLTLYPNKTGYTIDYSTIDDWPDGHTPPADATTADVVFPTELGVDAPRVLARTSTECNKQESNMIKDIIAQVDEYNETAREDEKLSIYKAFEGSKADVIICRKGTEVFLPDDKTIDITSGNMVWVGLQVKTGTTRLRTNKSPLLQFANVVGYGDLIALVCINVDNHDESFYFDKASDVEEYTRHYLIIPVEPKQKKKIASIKKLRRKHQIKFADLPAMLSKLYAQHAADDTLMSWRQANDPSAKGDSTDKQVA